MTDMAGNGLDNPDNNPPPPGPANTETSANAVHRYLEASDLTPEEEQQIRDILIRASLRKKTSGRGNRPRHRRSDTEDEDDCTHGRDHTQSSQEYTTTPDLSEEEMEAITSQLTEGELLEKLIATDEKLQNETADDTGFVTEKRKRNKRHRPKDKNPPQLRNKNRETKKGKTQDSDFAIPTSNSFEILKDDDNMEVQHTQTVPATTTRQSVHRPPPLVVYHTKNYLELNKALKSTITGALRAIYKGDHIKYHFDTMEDYKSAAAFLEANHLHFFTHQTPDERSLKVVIHGIPEVVPTQDIKEDLTTMGYDIQNIHQYSRRDRTTRELVPQSTFTISLPKEKKSEKIYNERYILNTRVRIENYEPKDGPPQCKNCQRLRHTAKYCHLPPRCVKCAGPHTTAQCRLRPTDKPTCALCGAEGHPASWRGCPEYQKALKPYRVAASRSKQATMRQQVPPPPPAGPSSNDFPPIRSGRGTYAAAVSSGREGVVDQDTTSSLGDSLREISTFLSSLLQQDIIAKLKATATRIKNATDTMGKIMALIEGVVTIFA